MGKPKTLGFPWFIIIESAFSLWKNGHAHAGHGLLPIAPWPPVSEMPMNMFRAAKSLLHQTSGVHPETWWRNMECFTWSKRQMRIFVVSKKLDINFYVSNNIRKWTIVKQQTWRFDTNKNGGWTSMTTKKLQPKVAAAAAWKQFQEWFMYSCLFLFLYFANVYPGFQVPLKSLNLSGNIVF